MLCLVVSLCASKEHPEITAAKELQKQGKYDEVIERLTRLIESEERPPVEAYYYRGKAHFSKMELQEALEDYNVTAHRSKRAEHQQIASNRLYDICSKACHLDCPAEELQFDDDQELVIKNRREAKRQRLSENATLELRVQMMGVNCSWDGALIRDLFRECADAQDMDGLVRTTAALRVLHPLMKEEMYRMDLVVKLAQMVWREQWALVEHQFFAVLPMDDDAPYRELVRLARLMLRAYGAVGRYAPQREGDAGGLRACLEEISRVDTEAFLGLFEATLSRVSSAAFGAEERIALPELRSRIQEIQRALACYTELNKPCPWDNVVGNYASALAQLRGMKEEITRLKNATQHGENKRVEIETLQKKIPHITRSLYKAHAGRADNTSYLPLIEETIDFFEACSDHLFLLAQENAVTDHYKVLGVPRDASLEDIKTAYYKIAKRLHPDVISQAITPQERQRLQREFELAQIAYEVLTDSTQKQAYDAIADPLDNYKYKRAKHDGRKRIDRTYILTGRKE